MAEEKVTAVEETVEKKAPAKKAAAKKPAAEKKTATKTAAKKPAAKKAPAKKAAAAGSVTIKLTKSLIGRSTKQIATANALGLKRVGDVKVQPDNAATQGKINVVSHLVEVTKA